ncbi:hypothetical protein CSB37_03015 [bacterium DOLZORAL124_38_8]|nr:MAG: hypothetical protein CSB37_03015 [bacterium DOLZORAL124_38_8]
MNDQLITCPNCHHQFSASDELQKHLSEEFEKKMKAQADAHQKQLEAEKEVMRKKAQEYAEKKAQEALKKNAVEIEDMKNQLKEAEKKQAEANQRELEFLKKERALKEKEKNVELELEKKLQAEKKRLEEALAESQKKALADRMEELQNEHRKKEAEKDKQMEQLKKALDEAKRKAEQGSQQIQGDVLENDIKELLQSEFLIDDIADVPTGIRGADLIQTVKNNLGAKCGVFLWELKNTKAWTEGWIQKLKDDQAALGADVAILATKTLPEGVDRYEYRNGVWVVEYESVKMLASILRFHQLEIGKVKNSLQGQDEKMQMLFEYLSSPQFKNRVENIVNAFDKMKTDLDKEKRAMQNIWNRREKELERVMINTAGFYGDLQGIAGANLPMIEALELPSGE